MKLRISPSTLEIPDVLHVIRASSISPPERNVVALFPHIEDAQTWLRLNQSEWTRTHPGTIWIETVEAASAARGEG